MTTNEEVVKEFTMYGTNELKRAGHLYFNYDVLYSYGIHFPLLVRLKEGWILNKDKYSVTTSKHRSICKRHIKDYIEMTTQEIKNLLFKLLTENHKLRLVTLEDINKLRICWELEHNENKSI